MSCNCGTLAQPVTVECNISSSLRGTCDTASYTTDDTNSDTTHDTNSDTIDDIQPMKLTATKPMT